MGNKKAVSTSLILMQLLTPIGISSSFANTATSFTTSHHAKWLETSSIHSTALNAQETASMAKSLAVSNASEKFENWLNQFGTARLSLNVDDYGNFDHSSFDYLLPIYANSHDMLFTQLGFRAPDERQTLNTGLGVRTLKGNWLYGMNIFFDQDFTGNNKRVGTGIEAWRDFFKLSANTYFATSKWKNSRDFEHYEERPANGWDIHAEYWLPALPQWGGKLLYEHYLGDEVALVNKTHRQKNPHAGTIGVTYTPVPLVSTGIDYRKASGGHDEAFFGVQLNYQFDQSLSAQLNPSQVAASRTLESLRTQLVERNNTIVMNYREKPQQRTLTSFTLSSLKNNSPADGVSENSVQVKAVQGDGKPAAQVPVTWSVTGSAVLSSAQVVTDENGMAIASFTSQANEVVTVMALVNGVQQSINSTFSAKAHNNVTLVTTKENALADGHEAAEVEATVVSPAGEPLADIPVTFNLEKSEGEGVKILSPSVQTDANGKAKTQIIASGGRPSAPRFTVLAQVDEAEPAKTEVAFSAAKLSLSWIKERAKPGGYLFYDPANPDERYEVIAVAKLVREKDGSPIVGKTVKFSSPDGVELFRTNLVTDANGEVKLTMVSMHRVNIDGTEYIKTQLQFALEVEGLTQWEGIARFDLLEN